MTDIPPEERRRIRETAARTDIAISGIHWVLVKAEGDNDAIVDSDAGSAGGLGGISASSLEAIIGGGVKAELDGDVTGASSVKVEAIGNNNASATAFAIAIGGLGAGAGATTFRTTATPTPTATACRTTATFAKGLMTSSTPTATACPTAATIATTPITTAPMPGLSPRAFYESCNHK